MNEAVFISAVRTAVGKSKKGALATVNPEDIAAITINEVIKRGGLADASIIDDVILGCAIPEKAQGYNIARNTAVRAGLSYSVPGVTVNRFCSSGLQTIAIAAQQIMSGMGECIIAGGVESMSMLPMDAQELIPNPYLINNKPELFMSMGVTAENVAEKYGISREEQDAFSLESHRKAIEAIDNGVFTDAIVPVPLTRVTYKAGKVVEENLIFDTDEGPRRNSSMEGLLKLRPVFKLNGTVTAGNSSQTSDGAAVALLMSGERAKDLGLKAIARFKGYAVMGVDPAYMGLGPIVAVRKALKQTGLSLKDIDVIELNEAFASQSIAVMRDLELDPAKVNPNGGAIALGHPLGCTGAKLVAQIITEMKRRNVQFGLVTMCIGGGMGAAAIIENL